MLPHTHDIGLTEGVGFQKGCVSKGFYGPRPELKNIQNLGGIVSIFLKNYFEFYRQIPNLDL